MAGTSSLSIPNLLNPQRRGRGPWILNKPPEVVLSSGKSGKSLDPRMLGQASCHIPSWDLGFMGDTIVGGRFA